MTKTTLVKHGVTNNLEENEIAVKREDAKCDNSREPHAKGSAPRVSPLARV